jgi:hypothetical protein
MQQQQRQRQQPSTRTPRIPHQQGVVSGWAAKTNMMAMDF